MLNAGIDKSMVQRLLHHTDSKMTDRYAEYSTSALKIALDNVIRIPDLKVRSKQNRKSAGDLKTAVDVSGLNRK